MEQSNIFGDRLQYAQMTKAALLLLVFDEHGGSHAY